MPSNPNIITEWLDTYGDPETNQRIAQNLQITEKVRLALEEKGWSKADLAQALGRPTSEIETWLSGFQTISPENRHELGRVLGIGLE